MSYYCQNSPADIILLSFLEYFPAQGNGYPGINFGNQCGSAAFPGPGYAGTVDTSKDHFLSACYNVAEDVPICQALGKTILLSIGGAGDVNNQYSLNSEEEGTALATFIFKAFGPYDSTSSVPRPFGNSVVLDGFDFDLEHTSEF